jgi:diguanylate cyclase (GGDEF)-like protein
MVGVASFAFAAARITRELAARSVAEQARYCANVLVSSPSGDLRPSINRLQKTYDPLVAVVPISTTGEVEWANDASSDWRGLATEVLLAGGAPTAATLSANGGKQKLWGVTVALNGSKLPSARQVLLLFRDPFRADAWTGAAVGFTCAVVFSSLVALLSFRLWLTYRVIRPLAGLGHLIPASATDEERDLVWDAGGWRETQSIVGHFRELCRGLAASRAAVRRVRSDTRRRLLERERGFDRRLRRVEDRATIDPLTGLRNRRYLDTNLGQIVTAQRASGKDLSVVMMDLDNFKTLNDTCGHQAGDDLLRCTGELLRAVLRPTDHAIRYGGDEFLLLLPGVAAVEAFGITERLLKLFGQSASLVDLSGCVSLSAGVASRKADECDDGWQLIAKADAALYAAKRGGKNTVALSSLC